MASGMDGGTLDSTANPATRLDRSYRELAAVLERSDLQQEERFAEAVIDALDAIDRAQRLAIMDDSFDRR